MVHGAPERLLKAPFRGSDFSPSVSAPWQGAARGAARRSPVRRTSMIGFNLFLNFIRNLV
jgi:hypothetical protein